MATKNTRIGLKSNQKHLILIGPPGDGKMAICEHLRQYCKAVFHWDIGVINIYEHQNIGDQSACDMFSTFLTKTDTDLIVHSGFHRSFVQIKHADTCGAMGENALAVLLNANRQTCLEEMIRKHRIGSGGPRFNGDAFNERYQAFHDSIESLKTALELTHTKLFQIDANRRFSDVFDDIIPILGMLVIPMMINQKTAAEPLKKTHRLPALSVALNSMVSSQVPT
jgi:adenylate kinase family enzyme